MQRNKNQSSQKPIDILYLCDRKACENCHEECKHTHRIEHAINKDNLAGCVFVYVDNNSRIGFIEINEKSGIGVLEYIKEKSANGSN